MNDEAGGATNHYRPIRWAGDDEPADEPAWPTCTANHRSTLTSF